MACYLFVIGDGGNLCRGEVGLPLLEVPLQSNFYFIKVVHSVYFFLTVAGIHG